MDTQKESSSRFVGIVFASRSFTQYRDRPYGPVVTERHPPKPRPREPRRRGVSRKGTPRRFTAADLI
jgi:hypothetical protein